MQSVIHFKIYDTERQLYWTQNRYGYSDEAKAGRWTLDQLKMMPIELHHHLIPSDPEDRPLFKKN